MSKKKLNAVEQSIQDYFNCKPNTIQRQIHTLKSTTRATRNSADTKSLSKIQKLYPDSTANAIILKLMEAKVEPMSLRKPNGRFDNQKIADAILALNGAPAKPAPVKTVNQSGSNSSDEPRYCSLACVEMIQEFRQGRFNSGDCNDVFDRAFIILTNHPAVRYKPPLSVLITMWQVGVKYGDMASYSPSCYDFADRLIQAAETDLWRQLEEDDAALTSRGMLAGAEWGEIRDKMTGGRKEPTDDQRTGNVLTVEHNDQPCDMDGVEPVDVDGGECGEANDRQVGGEHYRIFKKQHWDFAAEMQMDYFQGAITKYICRWKFKNGVQDLEKALHYLQKYIETASLYLD